MVFCFHSISTGALYSEKVSNLCLMLCSAAASASATGVVNC